VKVALPALTVVLEVISKSCTLNEGVLILVSGHVRVRYLEVCEEIIGGIE